MPARPLPACLALALAACTSATTPAPDAGALDTCSSDAECPGGFKCDRQQRRCVCTGDTACPGGFCNAFTGACVASVPGCTADSACQKSEYCDRGLRSCKPLTGLCGACKSDAQCGAGSRCAAHPSYPAAGTFCVPQCSAPDGGAPGCANGLTCLARDQSASAEKLCYPSQGACGVSNACTPDSRTLCATDGDCNDQAQVCDATLKWCVSKVRGCPAGDACDPQQRVCVHGCSQDADCVQIEGGPGYKCSANACIKLALCSADADCTDGQDCVGNPDGSKSCAAGCVQNADCPLGQSCDKTDPKHPKCVQGCSQSSDCALNNICVHGTCKGTLSGSDGNCAQTCQDTIVCATASKCDAATSCCKPVDLAAVCPTVNSQTPAPGSVCQPCVNNGTCPSTVSACAANCFQLAFKQCQSLNDCSSLPGTVCTSAKLCQTMVHVLPCASDADCPWKGFRCRLRSSFCGQGEAGSICLPDEQSAQVACLQGHL